MVSVRRAKTWGRGHSHTCIFNAFIHVTNDGINPVTEEDAGVDADVSERNKSPAVLGRCDFGDVYLQATANTCGIKCECKYTDTGHVH